MSNFIILHTKDQKTPILLNVDNICSMWGNRIFTNGDGDAHTWPVSESLEQVTRMIASIEGNLVLREGWVKDPFQDKK